ncbi:MAG: hypothetical protein AAFY35_07340 [Pseudomonadota bacterium]
MRDAPTRHAMLFELLRQENLSNNASMRAEPQETEADWQARYLVNSAGTLRRRHDSAA